MSQTDSESRLAFEANVARAAQRMFLICKIRRWPIRPVPAELQCFSKVVLEEAWRRVQEGRKRASWASEDGIVSPSALVIWMRESGISQSEWARRLGIKQATISYWWRLGRVPPPHHPPIMQILDESVAFGGDDHLID